MRNASSAIRARLQIKEEDGILSFMLPAVLLVATSVFTFHQGVVNAARTMIFTINRTGRVHDAHGNGRNKSRPPFSISS